MALLAVKWPPPPPPPPPLPQCRPSNSSPLIALKANPCNSVSQKHARHEIELKVASLLRMVDQMGNARSMWLGREEYVHAGVQGGPGEVRSAAIFY